MNSQNFTHSEPDKIEYIEIASINELENGERLFIEIDGKPIVVFNIAGELYATGDVCTHDDGPLGEGSVEGHVVACPRHGAKFDVRTGKVLSLPAIVDIPAYPVRLIDGHIEIGFPK